MNELQAQLQEVTDQLSQLDPNNRDNLIEIAGLKAQQAELTSQAAMEEAEQSKIESETQEITSFLDSLEIQGLTMRDLTVGENEYQMLRIAVETKLIEQSVKAASEIKFINLQHQEDLRAANDRESQLKRQNESLQERLTQETEQAIKDAEELTRLEVLIAQLQLDKADAEAKRDAAVAKAEGLELMLSEKQEQIELLRTENAIGAVRATQVIDQTAQIKELAEKIKASRIHVYGVTPDNEYAPKNFTAKRADTGETVTYNWTQTRNYIELKDAAEVERFRLEHAEQSPVPNPTLDTPIEIQPIAEVTAPEVQFPVQEVHSGHEVAETNSPVEVAGTAVTRDEFEALKALVKQCCEVCDVDIAEVA